MGSHLWRIIIHFFKMEWRFREDDLQIFLRLKAKLEQIWPQVPSSDSSYYVPMLEEEIDQSSSLLD